MVRLESCLRGLIRSALRGEAGDELPPYHENALALCKIAKSTYLPKRCRKCPPEACSVRECEFFPDDLPRVTDIGYPTDALPRVTAGTNQAWPRTAFSVYQA